MRCFSGVLLACVLGFAQAEKIPSSALPPQAHEVLARIASGGPFPYRRDGIVFGNFERRLPPAPRGYYREYTVPTPSVRQRGARRIVCGGQEPRRPDVCYYSPDHYRSFLRIVE
ncbi:MAG: ribonuclease domain-containing protein [Rhodocyclaceae bacterium]